MHQDGSNQLIHEQGFVAAPASGVSRATLSRTLPFALFMAFIGVEEGARFLASAGILSLPQGGLYYLYPFKAASAALLLYLYKDCYTEISLASLTKDRKWLTAVTLGLVTCLLWVCMPWTLTASNAPPGFDPGLLPEGGTRSVLIGFRVAGAVLVVPLMEELFWRSFLLRYLIDPDFQSVAIGRITFNSFVVTTILFGLEHHFFFAGIMAGVVYSVVLYRTRSITHCVLAHAVTNLVLACYVLYSGKWYFW